MTPIEDELQQIKAMLRFIIRELSYVPPAKERKLKKKQVKHLKRIK
jgi:hypothetical protein